MMTFSTVITTEPKQTKRAHQMARAAAQDNLFHVY